MRTGTRAASGSGRRRCRDVETPPLHDHQASKALIAEVEQLIIKRIKAKKNKDYQLADQIRSTLSEKGVEIQDKGENSTWSWKK